MCGQRKSHKGTKKAPDASKCVPRLASRYMFISDGCTIKRQPMTAVHHQEFLSILRKNPNCWEFLNFISAVDFCSLKRIETALCANADLKIPSASFTIQARAEPFVFYYKLNWPS